MKGIEQLSLLPVHRQVYAGCNQSFRQSSEQPEWVEVSNFPLNAPLTGIRIDWLESTSHANETCTRDAVSSALSCV